MLTEVLAEKLELAAPNMVEEVFPPKVFELLKAPVFAPNCPKACWEPRLPRDWMGGPAWAVPDNERAKFSPCSQHGNSDGNICTLYYLILTAWPE